MSTSDGLAAVTETLRQLLDANLGGPDCTAGAPDTARNRTDIDQVNLFLYAVEPNPAWASRGTPSPLALNLSYLLTAYGQNEDEIAGQAALGGAMRILHDHPVLGRDELRLARAAAGLHEQPERVRIAHTPMSLDEMTKLWTAVGSAYRLSTSYVVTVVLIDARRTAPAALPVLARGDQTDRGVDLAADPHRFPTLEKIATVGEVRRGPRLGDRLRLVGHRLEGGTARLVTGPRDQSADLPIEVTATGDLEVALPPDNAVARQNWPAGVYTLAVAVTEQNRTLLSNEVPFPLAPRLVSVTPNPAARVGGAVTLTVTAGPWVRRNQRISLLLGDREVSAEPMAAGVDRSATAIFRIIAAPPGDHLVRLRLDGVDSQPYAVDPLTGKREFAAAERVTIT